jgi:hypothetical protein
MQRRRRVSTGVESSHHDSAERVPNERHGLSASFFADKESELLDDLLKR